VPWRGKSAPDDYGAGLSVRVPVSEQELLQAVEDVADDGIIQGTKEYNKDDYVSGAEIADRTRCSTNGRPRPRLL